MKNDIRITKYDYDRLISMIQKYKNENKANAIINDLLKEIKRAKKVDPYDIPPDFVTMNSIIELKDLGMPDYRKFRLVFPNEADNGKDTVSVLAPIGTAVLGYRIGDVIKWKVADGEKYFQISKILYQPEANGDFHL